jgi:hypothetical protein
MSEIIAFDSKERSLLESYGLFLRKPTLGRELDLIYSFLDSETFSFLKNKNTTIFIEPRILNSYPDIVFVQWDAKKLEKRSRLLSRKSLLLTFRLLQYLSFSKGCDVTELKSVFGNYYRQSIESLYDAKLISKKGKNWKAKPLEEIFAISSIISVEAKMKMNSTLLNQAIQNVWFSSESYVLLPDISFRSSKSRSIVDRFLNSGIGIFGEIGEQMIPFSTSEKRSQPCSYASWFFNEWVLALNYM